MALKIAELVERTKLVLVFFRDIEEAVKSKGRAEGESRQQIPQFTQSERLLVKKKLKLME